ncbi:MAG: ribbon-helix-helix domain-containing protein [Thermoplasmata archaeon]|nr:ribbon-helix-helix domain-containing protein [Thermoplasmata archaeon]
MFDKAPDNRTDASETTRTFRRPPEDERIALRCNRKELQLLDTFVSSGEFVSRSELMRAALRAFLRTRTESAVLTPPTPAPTGLIEAPVRLRQDEVETFREYGVLVSNDQPLSDVLGQLVRRGALELKVSELVASARSTVRQAAEERAQIKALETSGRDLERQGVVGR